MEKMNDKANKLMGILNNLQINMEDLISIMHDLDDMGYKKTAKKLDTLTGKIENIIYELSDKIKD